MFRNVWWLVESYQSCFSSTWVWANSMLSVWCQCMLFAFGRPCNSHCFVCILPITDPRRSCGRMRESGHMTGSGRTSRLPRVVKSWLLCTATTSAQAINHQRPPRQGRCVEGNHSCFSFCGCMQKGLMVTTVLQLLWLRAKGFGIPSVLLIKPRCVWVPKWKCSSMSPAGGLWALGDICNWESFLSSCWIPPWLHKKH